ncbi:MAG: putative DNA-binding domain-containing protein [Pseudomonadota bacterium]
MNAANTLAREQSLLCDALFGNGLLPPDAGLDMTPGLSTLQARGWQAYRANAEALANRALAAAYPVMAELMGEESFAPMAALFWRLHPPVRGDMAQWGDGLPDFLDAAPQLADEPFLGDVARVEWALHGAATAADTHADLPSLALLAGDDADSAGLTLSAGAMVLASDWPVAAIIAAHQLSGASKTEALAQLAGRLKSGHGEHVLVWRQGLRPCVRAIGAVEYALVSSLLAGQALEAALDSAVQSDAAPFEFSVWLANAVHTGLVTGANIISRQEA